MSSRHLWLLTLAFMSVIQVTRANAQDNDGLPVIDNTSMTFAQALTIASANNLDVKIAVSTSKAVADEAASTKAQEMPSLSATTYGSYGDSPSILSSSPNTAPSDLFVTAPGSAADQNFTLSIPLLTSGKLSSQNLSARLMKQSSEASIGAAKNGVSEALVEAYSLAALDKDLIAVAQAHLDAENEQVRVTQENVDQGHSAPVDLLRDQADQASAAQTLISSQNDEQLALISLKTVLGISQESLIDVSDSLDVLVKSLSTPASLADALSEADKLSPSLMSARYASLSAAADTAASKSNFGPQVYGVIMSDSSSMRDGDRSGYTAAISASLPLFDDGARKDQLDEAHSKQEIAADQEKKIIQDVEQSVASSWLDVATSTTELGSAQKGVDASRLAYTLADLKYNAGKSTAADRLDALSAFVQAQEAFDAATESLVIAKAKLADAIGG